ncbi:MAG TPA: FeoA family protein [Myxococcota bacterium]|jgi:Fe2+ transport system protein FeoA|nr:FeoA family protein [Myxococcota bacterium]
MAATPLSPISFAPSPVRSRVSETEHVGLDALEPGERGVVHGMRGDGPIERRLQDLGLLPGTRVLVLRRAPLGDPIEYELRGYRLCLRRTEARRVLVDRSPAPVAAPSPSRRK